MEKVKLPWRHRAHRGGLTFPPLPTHIESHQPEETMNAPYEPIRFIDLVKTGRTVAFVPSHQFADDLACYAKQALNDGPKPHNIAVRQYHIHDIPLKVLNEWNLGDRYKPHGVLIVPVPMFATGVRLIADRVCWFGPVPRDDDYRYGIYTQSMARCDKPNTMVPRHHYTA